MWKLYHTSRSNGTNSGWLLWRDQHLFSSVRSAAFYLDMYRALGDTQELMFSYFNFKVVRSSPYDEVLLYVNGDLTEAAFHRIELELQERTDMPIVLAPNTPNATPATEPAILAPASDGAPAPLVSVAIKRSKPSHRLVLEINAKPLHDLLDGIGVPHDRTGYTERPSSTYRVASGDNLSTELFLKREYPVSVDLSQILSAPVSHSRLEALANSTHAALSKILEFYQPVDIQINVLPKIAK